MDLELSREQEDLRDEFRRLLADQCGHDVRRAAMHVPGAVDRRLWARLADTGVFSLRLPEDAGGLGAGMAEAVVVQEEIGRAAVPGPVAATSVLTLYLPGAATGATVATIVFEAGGPTLVEHLAGADLVVVISPEGVRSVPAAAVTATELQAPLDPLTPVHRPSGALPAGTPLGGRDTAERIREEGSLMTAATHVGLGAAAVDTGTRYATERTQFGRAIGSFQAVKHLLADAFAEVELARAAVHSAAVMFDETAGPAVVTRAVVGARVLASRAAQRATRACIQVHGGMGYTWDIDAHLYLKRALVLDTHFGSLDEARDRLVSAL